MKYFNELTDVESEIIRLDALKSLMTVVSNGIETTAKPEDIENTFWHILGSLEDIVEKLYQSHGILFDAVRDDELAKDEDIVYNFEPLTDVVNSWVRK